MTARRADLEAGEANEPSRQRPLRGLNVRGDLIQLDLDDQRWLTFLQRTATSPLQLPAWATFLAECYGFGSFALAAETEGGDLIAGIPVVEARGPLGRVRWISLPFTDQCDVLGAAPDGFGEALDSARRRAGVGAFEIRAQVPGIPSWPRGFVHRLSLEPGLDGVMRGYRSSVSRGIRNAERQGVTVRVADRRQDLVETFYALHVRTRKRLGVPVQRRRYFRLLWERMIEPGHGFVLVAEHESAPVAAAVFLRGGGTVLYKYGASNDRVWSLRANNALFHEAIALAVEEGATTFDWGRTDADAAGLRRFKTSWGAVEQELTYSVSGAAVPDGEGRGRSVARAVIRRSPAVVSRIAGALLYRYAA